MQPTTPMKAQPTDRFKNREYRYLEQYRETHMTLIQICNKYSISRKTGVEKLPKPDVMCPYGNHTRLWLRTKVVEIFEGSGK